MNGTTEQETTKKNGTFRQIELINEPIFVNQLWH